MIILRIFGLWLLALAFIALVIDGTRSVAAGKLMVTPLAQHWYEFHAPSLNLTQATVERYTFPIFWDPLILSILWAPAWLIFGLLGIALAYLGRRRRISQIIAN